MESKFAFLLKFIVPYKRKMSWVIVVTIIKSILIMAPPMIIKVLFDEVIVGGDREPFFMLALMLLVIPIGLALTTFSQVLNMAILGQRIIFDIRNAIFRHLEEMSLRFYNKYGTGLLINRLMGDTSTLQSILTNSLITVVSDLVICLIACIAAILINWRLGSILVVIITLFVVNYQYLKYKLIESKRQTLETMDKMTEGVQERLNLNLTVRSYGREIDEHALFSEQTDESVHYGSISGTSNVDFASNTELLTFLGWGVVYFVACSMYMDGIMTYGSVIAFTTYAMQVLAPAVRFSNLARQIQDVGVALDRIFEIHREEPELNDPEEPVTVDNMKGSVDFDHVNFHYNKGTPVLRDFDLNVKAGETIALVGKTGCGKSTVLNLIFRFYDVIDGAIRIDGIDLRDYRVRDLRRHFGIVLQEPMLFEDTIANNIRYADMAMSMDRVIEASKMAELHDYIMEYEHGYETLVGGRMGLTLSAGQQQQLTIARAIARDPAILVMDEATSNLDSESEARIQRALDRVLVNRTCFVVAHRLSTIRNASRIVCMDHGTILEIGSHDELVQIDGGHYRALYEKHLESGVFEENA
jgi:ATP-binding cassette, subfamily B, bacterial MsbA